MTDLKNVPYVLAPVTYFPSIRNIYAHFLCVFLFLDTTTDQLLSMGARRQAKLLERSNIGILFTWRAHIPAHWSITFCAHIPTRQSILWCAHIPTLQLITRCAQFTAHLSITWCTRITAYRRTLYISHTSVL